MVQARWQTVWHWSNMLARSGIRKLLWFASGESRDFIVLTRFSTGIPLNLSSYEW